MKTRLEVISPVKRKILVELDPGEVDRKLEVAYRILGKTARVQGFRPGKAPRRILERYYGEQVAEDVAREIVRDTLPGAVEETKSFPIAPPVVENGTVKAGQGFSYSAVMEVKPDFELKDYMGIEAEKEIVRVTDEDVEKQMEEIRKANGRLVPVGPERGVRESDYVIVDYEGRQDGKIVEGAKASNFPLRVGGNEFHPDFEKALVGRKVGDTLQVSVSFAAEFRNPKLAGKRVDFDVKVNDIREVVLPELNDDFARNLSADFQSLDDLRKKIREDLASREEKRADRDLKRRLMQKISNLVDFELPESLIESEIDYAISTLTQNLSRMGSNMERAGIRQEKLREEFRPGCMRRVKELLILGEVARQNGLTVEDAELEEGFSQMAAGMNQDPAAVKRYYETNELTDSYRQRLLEEKTLNYLVKGARIKAIEASQLPAEEN
ncbi:MAG: trigger factor [Thermodesulfobacteriota bacterium]